MRRGLLVAVAVLVGGVELMAFQSRTIQSRSYAAGTRTIDLPQSAVKKFTGMGVTLTRENWPGASTVAVAASETDAQLILPVGAGDQFPLGEGGRLRVRSTSGAVEIMQLVSRVGDVLTVTRGATPILVDVGSTVRLLSLVILRFEVSTDNGQTWQPNGGGAEIGGGTIIDPNTGLPAPSSSAAFGFGWNGAPIERDGDVRLVITNRVAFRTEITVRLFEAGD